MERRARFISMGKDNAMVKAHDCRSSVAPDIPWMMEIGEALQAEHITGIHDTFPRQVRRHEFRCQINISALL